MDLYNLLLIDSGNWYNTYWNVWRDKWDFWNLIFELEENW